jgi:hypothetical protein
LRDVQGPRRLEQRVADVFADDLVILAAELGHQLPLALEQLGRRRGETVLRDDVHGDELALHPLRHAGCATDEPLAVRGARQRDHHALPRLPRRFDAVAPPVLLEAFVDSIREPGQCELPQRREVPGPEVVGKGCVDPLGRVDVPACKAVAERERSQVDQLELIGAADDLVGNRLALLDARDLLDDVVQRLEVLDVERRDDVDPGTEQLLDVLPALLVAGTRRVRVRELVDQGDLRTAGQNRVHVHLLERGPAVVDLPARDDFEISDLRCRLRPSVRLHEADDDILAVLAAAPPLVEHRVRLADAGCGAEIDAEHSSRHAPRLRSVEGDVELEDVHARLAEEAE